MTTDERRVPMGLVAAHLTTAEKLHELATFHEAMRKLCVDSENGHVSAKALYHGELAVAATVAARHFEGMN